LVHAFEMFLHNVLLF